MNRRAPLRRCLCRQTRQVLDAAGLKSEQMGFFSLCFSLVLSHLLFQIAHGLDQVVWNQRP